MQKPRGVVNFELPKSHFRNAGIAFGHVIEVPFNGGMLVTRDVFQEEKLSYRLVAGYKRGEVDTSGQIHKIAVEPIADFNQELEIRKLLGGQVQFFR